MRNISLDLEAGNKNQGNRNQVSDVVYGYPVRPAAASHADYLLWMRTTSNSSSSSVSSSSDVETASPVNHRAKNLREVLFWNIVIGFLLGAIVWCAIGEVMNTHNYPNFEVDSIKFSPFNNGTRAPANWTVGVLVRNTNRYTRMVYEDFQVSVYYKEEQLSKTAMVSPLYLGPKNQTSVMTSLQGHSLQKKNSTASEIEEDRRRGVVNFDVVLQVKMNYFFRFPAIGGRKKVLKTELLCLDVQVGFWSNVTEKGSMIGGPYRCYSPLDVILGELLSSRS